MVFSYSSWEVLKCGCTVMGPWSSEEGWENVLMRLSRDFKCIFYLPCQCVKGLRQKKRVDVYFKLLLYKSMPGVVVSTCNRFLYLPEAFLFIKRLGNFTECYHDCPEFFWVLLYVLLGLSSFKSTFHTSIIGPKKRVKSGGVKENCDILGLFLILEITPCDYETLMTSPKL